jgi:hypothetical protein
MGFAAARREVGVLGALCGVRKAGSRIVGVVDSKRGLGITERQREGERERAKERARERARERERARKAAGP